MPYDLHVKQFWRNIIICTDIYNASDYEDLRNGLLNHHNAIFLQLLHQRVVDLTRHWSQDTLLTNSPVEHLLNSNTARNTYSFAIAE